MNKLTLILALSAAFISGAVFAETDAPKVVKAQSFALVDANGKTVGVFAAGHSPRGSSAVVLYDAQGREMWRASGDTTLPVSSR